MKKKYIFIIILFFVVYKLDAQCAMCRAVLESEADTSQAKGVNNGIVYLMMIPYILIAALGIFIYKTYHKKTAVEKK